MRILQKYKLVVKRRLKQLSWSGVRPLDLAVFLILGVVLILAVGYSAKYIAVRLGAKSTAMAEVYSDRFAKDTGNAVDSFKTNVKSSQASAAAAKAKAASNQAAKSKTGASNQAKSGSAGHFQTLAVGAALPSDATCSAQVRASPETRPANASANKTKGSGGNTQFSRVSGNFTGTTDEILQWSACKWGIDEDIVRAQAAMESWWFHRTLGDYTTDSALCAPTHPIGGEPGHPTECPESVGILQVRYADHKSAFVNNNALNSTSYNTDYSYAVWRDCYEGGLASWINDEEKGSVYAAGDAWGCIGEWFSGRWHTPESDTYINSVKAYLNQRIWETEDFLTDK